jgi:hypothetical protein
MERRVRHPLSGARPAPPAELLPFLDALAELLVADCLRRESGTTAQPPISHRILAKTAKRRNILEMAIAFTAMTRVLCAGANEMIADRLYRLTRKLEKIATSEEYETEHQAFCRWFCRRISTAQKKLKNGKLKRSRPASFGQAAKVLDIALKVIVHYCAQPSTQAAYRVLPWLHVAIDSPILKHLKAKYPDAKISATTIEQIDEDTYTALQKLIRRDILADFNNEVSPVEYDDIVWRWLNRTSRD